MRFFLSAQKRKPVFIISLLFLTSCNIIQNFHSLNPPNSSPKFYRSAQLTGTELSQSIQENDIQVVVNLRGEKPKKQWYREEIQACQKEGILHYDIKLSAWKAPSPQNLWRLAKILEESKEKKAHTLVHCRRGADRASFASALALVIVYDLPVKKAHQAFSWQYGHICFGNCPLEQILQAYEEHAKEMSFSQWVERNYFSESFE